MEKKVKKATKKVDIFDKNSNNWTKRKKRLNEKIEYNLECLNKDEFDYLKSFNFNQNALDYNEQQQILKIFNRIFNQKHKASSCRDCWKFRLYNLEIVYNDYKNNK